MEREMVMRWFRYLFTPILFCSVQLYAGAPQGALVKEYQRLVAFAKTESLAPGETARVTLLERRQRVQA